MWAQVRRVARFLFCAEEKENAPTLYQTSIQSQIFIRSSASQIKLIKMQKGHCGHKFGDIIIFLVEARKENDRFLSEAFSFQKISALVLII